MSESKPKLALYWAASCGGCEIAVLAINEKILDVDAAFEVVMWPCVMDGKRADIEAMKDGEITLCLFNGGIRNSEQEEMAKILRAKSKVMVAFGSCAVEGGIPSLANACTPKQIFDFVYHDSPSTDNPDRAEPRTEVEVPEGTLELPVFYDAVKTLAQTIEVDYFLPGCPPEPERIWDAVVAILEGKLPPPGAVIGADTTVCDDCKRKRSEKKIKSFQRIWQTMLDPELCLLEQGVICNGIATRAGCGALCPQVGQPCIGCYGPNDGVEDVGARMMAALSSVIDSDDPEEIERIIEEGIPDPVGTFYRFGLAGGMLRGAAAKEEAR